MRHGHRTQRIPLPPRVWAWARVTGGVRAVVPAKRAAASLRGCRWCAHTCARAHTHTHRRRHWEAEIKGKKGTPGGGRCWDP